MTDATLNPPASLPLANPDGQPNNGATATSHVEVERPAPPEPPAPPRMKRPKFLLAMIAVAVVAIVIVVFKLCNSHAVATQDAKEAPAVAAVKVHREDLWRDVVFNAEFQPYQEVDLHAKVAGYVQSINVDLGDAVREGDVIATLELPETQAELERAAAVEKRSEEEVRRAEAAHDDAHLSFTRVADVHKAQPTLVAQQDIDTALTKDRTTEYALSAARLEVEVAKAEVKKLQTMLGYAKITAPFSGVVTKRYADKGALIQAGTSSSTQAMPLVRLSQNNRLRLIVPVSVSFVSSIRIGDEVEVRVPSVGQSLAMKISRLAGKVDTHTRTMDVEIDVPNDDARLIPGAYATVSLKLNKRAGALAVPVEALSSQKRGEVFVINGDVLEERSIKLGLETPTRVEALSGLQEGDLLMVGSRSGVKPGQKVTAKIIDTDRERSL